MEELLNSSPPGEDASLCKYISTSTLGGSWFRLRGYWRINVSCFPFLWLHDFANQVIDKDGITFLFYSETQYWLIQCEKKGKRIIYWSSWGKLYPAFNPETGQFSRAECNENMTKYVAIESCTDTLNVDVIVLGHSIIIYICIFVLKVKCSDSSVSSYTHIL